MYERFCKTTYLPLLAFSISAGISNQTLSQTVPSAPPKKSAHSAAHSKVSLQKKGLQKAENSAIVTVTVRPQSEVTGGWFTLGEIAEIKGGDKTLREKLTAMQVGVSPLPGLSRTIWPGDIIVRLRTIKLDTPQVKVEALPETKITRSSISVEADEVTKAALVAGQAAIKDMPDASLEPVPGAQKAVLPTGKLLMMAGAFRGAPENGSIVIPMTMLVDGKVAQSIDVTLRVRRKAKVIVARRAIGAHEVVGSDDVYLATVQLPSGFTQPCLDLKDAVGKRARKNLAAEAPISIASLETPPAINANDKITIEWVLGTAKITAPGLSHQSGFIGDTIRVYATDTKKELDAVIIDSRTVRIVDDSDAGAK